MTDRWFLMSRMGASGFYYVFSGFLKNHADMMDGYGGARREGLMQEMFLGELHVLDDLQSADIMTLVVTDSHVVDIYRAAVLLHPYGHLVTTALTEVVDDGLDHRLDLRRMTGEDLPVDGH